MAYTPDVKGNDIALFLNTGGTDYLVVCLTSLDLDMSASEIDASSKCGSATLAGTIDQTVTFEGKMVSNASGNIKDFDDMIAIMQGQAAQSWKIKDTVSSKVYRAFNGVLTQYNESFPQDDVSTFGGTIRINGDIDITA